MSSGKAQPCLALFKLPGLTGTGTGIFDNVVSSTNLKREKRIGERCYHQVRGRSVRPSHLYTRATAVCPGFGFRVTVSALTQLHLGAACAEQFLILNARARGRYGNGLTIVLTLRPISQHSPRSLPVPQADHHHPVKDLQLFNAKTSLIPFVVCGIYSDGAYYGS